MTLDPLPTDVAVGDPFHAELHNQERARINDVADLVNAAPSIPSLPWLAAVPVWVYGDSYTRYAPPEATPFHRIAARYAMQPPINRGVSGTRCSQIYTAIEGSWVPNSRGFVGIGSATINNVRQYTASEDGYLTGAEAFRACLAYLSARIVSVPGDSGNPTRFGPGWTYDATIGGYKTSAANAYVDIAWTGNAGLDLFAWFTTGAGATVEVLDAAGTIVGFAQTGGYEENFTGVISVAPPGSGGTHTVRLRVTAGTFTLRRVAVRAVNPPLIVWDKPAEIPLPEVPGPELEEANVYMQDVADAFPNVVTADNNRAGWNYAAYISNDLAHRNDAGNAFATETIDAALKVAVTGYDQGLNSVTDFYADPDGYLIPTAAYQAVGAAVPAAPVLTATAANQVRTSWTRPNDNGATITGYTLQYRLTAGPGAWTTIASPDPAALSYLIQAGLVAGTSYDFRVQATNAVGAGAWSNTVTPVVAGSAPTFYSRDDFGTPNSVSLGNADVGGAWAVYNGAANVDALGNAVIIQKTNASLWTHFTVTDAQKDGYCEVTVAEHAISTGVLMCNNSQTNPTLGVAVVSYPSEGIYAIMFQVAVNNWVVSGSIPVVPKNGDRVGIHKAGNFYTPVINGVPQTTLSAGLSDLTSTRHGGISFGAGAKFANYEHSNVNPLL